MPRLGTNSYPTSRGSQYRQPGQGYRRPGLPANDPRPPARYQAPPDAKRLPVTFGKRAVPPPNRYLAKGAMLGLRAGARFIPYVGWALLAYELFSLWRQGQEGVLPAGWEMQCGTTTAWVGGGSAGNNCGIPSQLAEKDLSGHTDIRWMEATHFPGQQPADWGTFWRGRIVGTARRVSGSGDFPGLQSGPPSTEPETPVPNIWRDPWIDPFSLPIAQPVPVPQPRPISRPDPRQQNPYRHPAYQPNRGYGANAVSPGRYNPPYRDVSVNTTVSLNLGVRQARGYHNKLPPGNRTKEKKGIANVPPGLLSVLLGQITEANDYVKAVYKALPANVRRWKGRDGRWRDHDITPQDQLQRIWENADKLDVGEVVKNLVANEIEDRILGRVGRNLRDAINENPYYKRPVGIQTGSFITPRPNIQ